MDERESGKGGKKSETRWPPPNKIQLVQNPSLEEEAGILMAEIALKKSSLKALYPIKYIVDSQIEDIEKHIKALERRLDFLNEGQLHMFNAIDITDETE